MIVSGLFALHRLILSLATDLAFIFLPSAPSALAALSGAGPVFGPSFRFPDSLPAALPSPRSPPAA